MLRTWRTTWTVDAWGRGIRALTAWGLGRCPRGKGSFSHQQKEPKIWSLTHWKVTVILSIVPSQRQAGLDAGSVKAAWYRTGFICLTLWPWGSDAGAQVTEGVTGVEVCLRLLCLCASAVGSVMSDSLWPHGLYPARPCCPRGSPGKNTGVGCYALLQGSSGPNLSLLGLLPWQAVSLLLAHLGSPLWSLTWSNYRTNQNHPVAAKAWNSHVPGNRVMPGNRVK